MEIDLGKKSDGGMCSPCEAKSQSSDTVYYPTLYLEAKDDKLEDLPESGTMMIQFKTVRWEESKTKEGERYCCTIEVQKILKVSSDSPEAPATKGGYDDASSALDALAKALKEKAEPEED